MGHYRDKGYGMGHRTGYIAGLRGERARGAAPAASPSRTTRRTHGLWRRWYRLLMVDMWGVFFVGAMLGMLLPTILMARAVELAGREPDPRPTCRPSWPSVLQPEYGSVVFYVVLMLGVLILFSTQLGIFEGDGPGHHRRRARVQPDACAR